MNLWDTNKGYTTAEQIVRELRRIADSLEVLANSELERKRKKESHAYNPDSILEVEGE